METSFEELLEKAKAGDPKAQTEVRAAAGLAGRELWGCGNRGPVPHGVTCPVPGPHLFLVCQAIFPPAAPLGSVCFPLVPIASSSMPSVLLPVLCTPPALSSLWRGATPSHLVRSKCPEGPAGPA